jgi:hypothetical protein
MAESNWPVLDKRALHGEAGRLVRKCERHTEADQAALLASLLTVAGLVGSSQGYAMRAGDVWHPPLLHANLVGRSAFSRKGTASAPILTAAHQALPWLDACTVGGFGSGQALVDHLKENPTSLIIEEELGALLRNAAQKGSTLSQIYRKMWDAKRVEARSRGGGKVVAIDYCAAQLAHVTLQELRATLTSTDIFGGSVNRNLWVATKRGKVLANRGNVPSEVITQLADLLKRLHKADGWKPSGTGLAPEPAAAEEEDEDTSDDFDDDDEITADSYLPPGADTGPTPAPRWKEPDWTPDAEELWTTLYERHASQEGMRLGLLAEIISRGDVQMLRLALIYMLLDDTTTLTTDHLTAAAAFWTYCRDTAAYIFGVSTGDQRLDKIIDALTAAGSDGVAQSDIGPVVLGSKNIGAGTIERCMTALESMVARTVVQTAGRPATFWKLVRLPSLPPLLAPPERALRVVHRGAKSS